MTIPVSPLLRTLVERGFVHQATDLAGLDERLARGPISAYIGFDLTAPSLHVGSMIQMMVLRHLKAHGHEAVVLLGDATTRVGDPSDKNGARPILTDATIEANRIGLVKSKNPLDTERQLMQVIPPEHGVPAHHWLILHGRYLCKARKPECWRCPIAQICRFKDKSPPPGR